MPEGKGWTKKDQREFDRLVTLMDSPRQTDRIEGRMAWAKFEARFTKAQLDEMWEGIKGK